MKLLYAECCGSIVVPEFRNFVPRVCKCGGSAVWWENGVEGRLAVFSRYGLYVTSVLGLNNGLLYEKFRTNTEHNYEYGLIQGDAMRKILADTPSSYLFKQVGSIEGSMIVRFRPGFSNDTRFVAAEEYAKLRKPDLRQKLSDWLEVNKDVLKRLPMDILRELMI